MQNEGYYTIQSHRGRYQSKAHMWFPKWHDDRTCFNCILSVFDIYNGTAPQYLSELVCRCDDTRLRSSVCVNFVVLRTQLPVTDKAFSITEPHAWNALPSDIRPISSRTSFRKKLKTICSAFYWCLNCDTVWYC